VAKNKYFGHFNDYGYNVAPPIGPLEIMKQSIINVFISRFKDATEMSKEDFCNIHDCRKIFKRGYDLLTLDALEAIYYNYSGIRLGQLLRKEISLHIDHEILKKLLSLNGGAWDGYKIETIPLEKLVSIFIFQRSIIDGINTQSVSEELLSFLREQEIKLIENSRNVN
jgi:hypothetical protein